MKSVLHLEDGSRLKKIVGSQLLELFAPPVASPVKADSNFAPKSTVALYVPGTPLEKSLLPKKFFSIAAAFAVEDIGEQAFREKLQSPAAQQLFKQLSVAEGPRLDAVHYKNCLGSMMGKDRQAWEVSLGSKGFCAISEEAVDRFTANRCLVVYATHDALSRDLHTYVDEKLDHHPEKPLTLKQLADSAQMQAAKLLAFRNVKLVAVTIAQTLGLTLLDLSVDRDSLPQLDLAAAMAGGAPAGSPKFRPLAVPFGISCFNHLYTGTANIGEAKLPAIAVYCHCGHPGMGSGQPIIPLNPIDGVLWIKANQADDFHAAGLNRLAIAGTLPCGTGHQDVSAPAAPTKTVQRYIQTCIAASAADKPLLLQHDKFTRCYNNRSPLTEMLQKAFLGSNIAVLEHVTSTVC